MRKHISHYDKNSCSFLEVKADTRKAIITETVTGADLSEPNKSLAIILKNKDQVQWLYHQLWYILEKDR